MSRYFNTTGLTRSRISRLVNTAIVGLLLLILLPSPVSHSEDRPLSESELLQAGVDACATRLFEEARRPDSRETRKLPGLYLRASRVKDVEFMQWALAVMYVESKFNRMAVSPKDARGLMQMTEIAVIEAERGCNLPRLADNSKLHESYTNVKYGTCFLSLMNRVAAGDWTRTLILYNGGYLQLQRYDRGESVVEETANYVIRVEHARQICRGEQ